MRVVAIASRKGGSGKTTLAGHLAVEAERQKAGPVAVADLDPQGSLSDWWNTRTANTPEYLQTTVSRLGDDILELRRLGLGLLVIDTPPALSSTIGHVVRHADLVVIPTRPSPHDLRSIGSTIDLVETLSKPLVFVINCATARSRMTYETVSLLSQHGPLAPTVVHQRVDFASSMIDGRTVMELSGAHKSAAEISDLWAFVAQRLDRQQARVADFVPMQAAMGG